MGNECYVLEPRVARVGESIVISLAEGCGSGFKVCLTGLPDCLALASGEQVTDEARTGCIKKPGVRRFTFIAVSEGYGELVFNKIKTTGTELIILESDALECQWVRIERE